MAGRTFAFNQAFNRACNQNYPFTDTKRTFSLKTLVSLAGALLLALTSQIAAAGDYGKQKVVYHINIDNPAALSAAMTNVQNHIDAVGKENLDLKVVMHGPGVDLLKIANTDMDMQSKIINLKSQGIAFNVCNVTLTRKKIDYNKDLFDVSKSDIVPSGVAEVAKLQGKGYVYIKP
jgi:intracellular sulfur oxidation DsrE/DsrF family protein